MARITSGDLKRLGNEGMNLASRGQLKPGVGNCPGNRMKKKIGANNTPNYPTALKQLKKARRSR